MGIPEKEKPPAFGEAGGELPSDRGGTRSGEDRRKNDLPYDGNDRRSGRDRRRGFDRRSGIDRRRTPERRNERTLAADELIERRDALRRLFGVF
ncbi:MAG: hypothetical protein WHT06_02015 [Desulfobacterales bacterium]